MSYFSSFPPLPGYLLPRGTMLYVLIVLALASFVFAFFSARTWPWGYVIVVELLFLSTMGFFLLASETVRINAVLRGQVNRTQKELDSIEAQNNALQNGDTNATIVGQLSNQEPPVKTAKDAEGNEYLESIADLDHNLLIWTRMRGRAWQDAKRAGAMNPQTGAVNVAIGTPKPAGIKPQTVVYLFDKGEPLPPPASGPQQGPQYLGEFTVTAAGPQQATLTPVLPLDEYERNRLAKSQGDWIIYETMPIDRHDAFAGKTDKELQQKLPKGSVGEFIRDGKPAKADDDPARVVGLDENGKPVPPADLSKAAKKLYQRRLRDYASEFSDMARRRIALLTEIDAVKKDIVRLETAEDVAKKIQAFREGERTKLTADLAGVDKEKAAIEKHLAEVNKLLKRARDLTADLLIRNDKLAAELAAWQLQAPKPTNGVAVPAPNTGRLALGMVK